MSQQDSMIENLIDWGEERKKIFEASAEKTPVADFLSSTLKRTSAVTSFLRKINSAGSGIIKLVGMSESIPIGARETGNALPFAGLALKIVDFIIIPIIWFYALASGKTDKFTLSHTGKFAYAAILLGLSIIALSIPILAPIFAVVSASVVLSVSIYKIYNLYCKQLINEGKINNFNKLIEHELAIRLKIIDNGELIKHEDKIDLNTVKMDYIEQTNKIQDMVNQRHKLQEKIKFNDIVMNKCIKLSFIAVTLIGCVMSLYFPPVGAIIVAVAGGLSLLYWTYGVLYGLYGSASIKKISTAMHEEPHQPDSTTNILASVTVNTPLADVIECTKTDLVVDLKDAEILSAPRQEFPKLANASREEPESYEFLSDDEEIHCNELDEDLSVDGLLLA